MYTIIKDAQETLKEFIENGTDFYNDEPHDVISEIADSAVPVYTATLLEIASNDVSLAVDEPELGPAFDGSPTPANIIAANIYERILDSLWEYWRSDGEELYQERQPTE